MIDLGFAIVVPEEQKFYLPSELAGRAMTLDHALKDKNKIAIFRGSYEHQGAVVFDESKEIIAEPGTEMIVCLRHRYISNMSVKLYVVLLIESSMERIAVAHLFVMPASSINLRMHKNLLRWQQIIKVADNFLYE